MTISSSAVTAFNAACAAASATNLVEGVVELLDSAGNVLASASLGTPTSIGAVTNMGGFPKTVTASTTGVVASARYRTSSAANWKTSMSVGLSGSEAEVILSSVDLISGQSVQFNSASLTHVGTAT
jgi:hypothetical protein